jgi:hypothetical protein
MFLLPELINEISKFMQNKNDVLVMYSLSISAIINGELKIIKWLNKNGKFDLSTFNFAVRHGNIKTVEWIMKNSSIDNKNIQLYRKINLKIDKFLIKNNFQIKYV